MTEDVKTIMYPVTDLANAKTLYGKLVGVEPYMDEAYYVGFNVGGQDIGLDPHGHSKGMTAPVAYWHVDDIEQRLEALLDAGAEAHQGVRDVGGGKLLASVKDTDGNVIGLIQSP
jgi:predicted enzyme related to lactoylglutathione lyase